MPAPATPRLQAPRQVRGAVPAQHYGLDQSRTVPSLRRYHLRRYAADQAAESR